MRLVFFICMGLLCARPGVAAQPSVLSLERLSEAADVVVHGVVISTTCERDGEGRIVTRVEFRAKGCWKGTTSTLPIVHSGGVLGDKAVLTEGQEQYTVGEEFVAFLKLNQRGEGVTVGMSQGKFKVWRKGSKVLVHSPFHGRGPAESEGAGGLALETLKRIVLGDRR